MISTGTATVLLADMRHETLRVAVNRLDPRRVRLLELGDEVTRENAMAVVLWLPRLITLNLKVVDMGTIIDDDLRTIAQVCPCLEVLSLPHSEDSGVALIQGCSVAGDRDDDDAPLNDSRGLHLGNQVESKKRHHAPTRSLPLKKRFVD